MAAPICPACQTAARLTDGREVYPRRPDLADKPIWVCTVCEDTRVGCQYGADGQPCCTAFEDRHRPARTPRCKATDDLFCGEA